MAKDDFEAEYERRFGRKPSSDEVKLEEAREAARGKDAGSKEMKAFKRAQANLAGKRQAVRVRNEERRARNAERQRRRDAGEEVSEPDEQRESGFGVAGEAGPGDVSVTPGGLT